MGKVVSVRAYANNEVVYVAWALDAAIPDCRGFDVRRIDVASGKEQSLPAWVPFEGQSNQNWQASTTAIWPVQRLSWKDLTWRDELDKQIAAAGTAGGPLQIDRLLKYRIVPMVGTAAALQPRAELAALSNPVHLSLNYGDISVAFNNGILSTQWLTNELKKDYGTDQPLAALKQAIAQPNNKIRAKLAGDTLPFLRRLLDRAQKEGGSVALALYELTDPELIPLLLQNKDRIRIILSNTSASDKDKKVWDTENNPVRKQLHDAGVQIQDRMFNNDHIGHNKFAVLLDPHGQPISVLTGSTNWTQNGLCAQSNNALLIDSTEVAAAYYAYWKRLLDDKLPVPNPISAPTKNVQGQALRRADMSSIEAKLDGGKTNVQIWFSPNTAATEKSNTSPTPPDLAQLFALMRSAKKTIMFLVFLPSMHGEKSIIEEAINMGKEDPSLLVLGAVSSAMAMPVAPGGQAAQPTQTFVVNSRRTAGRSKSPPTTGGSGGGSADAGAKPSPVFAENATEVVLASALNPGDLVGQFQAEMLAAGNAIIHDKIVVIDPLSDNAVVACGSHNLGYKASYGNDENLLIIRGNQALAQAYGVHVLDVYDHYRFRAEQQASGGKAFDGFLKDSDAWQQDYIEGRRGTDAHYFAAG
jgi:phosphatidylserine/phosphatidylglycerophosphate/cardiolipin synthase-like enzyme